MSVTLKQKYALLKQVRARPDISDAGKVLFEYLLIQCHNCRTLECRPGAETIMKASGWSLSKVRRELARLKKARVLRWRSGRTGRANEYDFPGLWSVTERDVSAEFRGHRTTSYDRRKSTGMSSASNSGA
jgi:hypothetical protein